VKNGACLFGQGKKDREKNKDFFGNTGGVRVGNSGF
jgi:hypothetical protein